MSSDILGRTYAATNAQLSALTTRLYAGEINVLQWSFGVAGVLKDAHIANALLAVAGDTLNPAQLLRVGLTLADELRYLFGFARGIAAGEVSEAQALARIRQYGNAAQQNYWREFAREIDNSKWSHLPLLTQAPRDGKTQCRGNCNCELWTESDGVHWVLFPGETCDDCARLSSGSPYRTR
jgi:hypothetical protein